MDGLTSRDGRRVRAVMGTVVLGMVCVLLPASPATATPGSATPGTATSDSTTLDDATERARTLRGQVDALEVQAALAAENQGAATEELGRVISDELGAQSALVAARDAGAQQRAQAGRRARALYMSGGHSGMVASVLSNSSVSDSSDELANVLLGMRAVRTLVADDAEAAEGARQSVDRAVAASAEVQQLRRDRQRLEDSAGDAAEQLEAALARQSALLAEADAEVVVLVERQRQEEEQAALARAAELTEAAGAGLATAELGTLPGAPTAAAQGAIDAATTMLGRPYRWGATGPETFDCSGLTSWAYRQAGIAIPRTSRSQYAGLPKVPLDQLAPGDLVFFAAGSSPSSIHHVGIYVGGGRMLHAPRTGDVVKISAVWRQELYGAARPAA